MSDELIRVQNDAYRERVADVARKLRMTADTIEMGGEPSQRTPINLGQRHGLAAERVVSEITWMMGNLHLGSVVAAATAADALEARAATERVAVPDPDPEDLRSPGSRGTDGD